MDTKTMEDTRIIQLKAPKNIKAMFVNMIVESDKGLVMSVRPVSTQEIEDEKIIEISLDKVNYV